MTLNIIRLNPSQELKLKKERAIFLGKAALLELDKKSGLLRQKIEEGQAVFLEPLFCVLPDVFTKEEFRALESLEFFLPQNDFVQGQDPRGKKTDKCPKSGESRQKSIYYFPVRARAKNRAFWGLMPCALSFEWKKDFRLDKVFLAAKDFANARSGGLGADEIPFDKESASAQKSDAPLFRASSFKFCRAEIDQNFWRLYDAVWKKLL